MESIKKISIFLFFITVAFSACNTTGQKGTDEEKEQQNEISEEFLEKQNELKQKASEEFSAVNEKVRELNHNIEEQQKQLSEELKLLLDTNQEKRVAANNRLKEIKNVSEEWETFKANFENDLEEIQTKLDKVFDDF